MNFFVRLDESGRLVLPKKIRDTVKSNEFEVTLQDSEKIVFIPVKSTDEMFGSMPDLDITGFSREHKKER